MRHGIKTRTRAVAYWSSGAPRSLAAAATLAALLSAGCGGAPDPGGIRAGVYGEVRLDGKPLEAGAIVFHSGAGAAEHIAFAHVEHGAYRIAVHEGPLVGTARVEFQPKPLPREQFEAALEQAARERRPPVLDVVAIPPQYGANSNLTAAVTEHGENRFDFDLRSRP